MLFLKCCASKNMLWLDSNFWNAALNGYELPHNVMYFYIYPYYKYNFSMSNFWVLGEKVVDVTDITINLKIVKYLGKIGVY